MTAITFIVTIAISFVPIRVLAAQRAITFQWQKNIIEPDLVAFELQYSTDAKWTTYGPHTDPDSGTWSHLTTVPFQPNRTQYEEQVPITVPDNTEAAYFFRIRAIDAVGNPSGWNYGTDELQCTTIIDFKPPEATINLKIIVQTADTE